MRVLCAGHVNWDVTLRLDRLPVPDGESAIRSRRQGGGGSAANVAAGLVGLDCEAALVGSVGDDENGLLATRDLAARGVDTDGVVTAPGTTATKYLLVDDAGEVSVLGAEGVNEAVRPEDIDPEYVTGCDHVHLTSQHPETARYLAALAAGHGIPVSFDPGRRVADRDFSAVIDHTDLLFVNEQEAAALGAVPCEVVATKFGTRGAAVETPDGAVEHAGFALDPVDTTGAGDAFAAGFLAARLRGEAPGDALAVANACGALAAAREGPKVPLSWEAVERLTAETG
ncbi:carbohydrate kinase family protein [Natronomonas sp. EA1]|uniref:carbohydrate kinase family protein n=1 Tax=Natronomonas sp. EA1 TaxID=3421655 RepID=UPI003EC0EB84